MYKDIKLKIINLLKENNKNTDEALFIVSSLFVTICNSKKIEPTFVLNILQDKNKETSVQKGLPDIN